MNTQPSNSAQIRPYSLYDAVMSVVIPLGMLYMWVQGLREIGFGRADGTHLVAMAPSAAVLLAVVAAFGGVYLGGFSLAYLTGQRTSVTRRMSGTHAVGFGVAAVELFYLANLIMHTPGGH